jgi:hypothetical protein
MKNFTIFLKQNKALADEGKKEGKEAEGNDRRF